MDNAKTASDLSEDKRLLKEIERLIRAAQELEPKSAGPTRLAVFRLFKGVPPERWGELSHRFGLDNWLALPIQAGEVPSLDTLQGLVDKLAYQSDHDPLTGLFNRRAFHENLTVEIERSRRLKSPMSLAMVDIDDFKSINDRYGHICGDTVLVELSDMIRSEIRKLDFAARLGGEEFGIILTGSGLLEALKVLDRLRDRINRLRVYCAEIDTFVSPTCSMGLACYKGNKTINPAELINEADKALYTAKAQGKNRIVTAALLGMAISDATLVKKEEKEFLLANHIQAEKKPRTQR
jgi:diguanylate cyclase (GGDEF)-like protein